MSCSDRLIRAGRPLRQTLLPRRYERCTRATYATAQLAVDYPSLQPKYPLPPKDFRPSQSIKQNRFDESRMKKIRVIPPIPSNKRLCPDPIKAVTDQQLTTLDPNGARTRLFSPANPDRAKPGDILLVRLKNSDPFSGICLNIRQRHQPIDTAILLRNQLTRVGVEMWFKVFSPNVEGIEIVQRKEKRARREKLYYLRQPRHDVGSLEGIVRGYLKQKVGGPISSRGVKGRDTGAHKKKNNKRGRN